MLIICLLSATASLAAAQKKASQPDVFLITIDTLRADHVHCYGYEHIQTPALDSLAKDGIRFAQAFTPSPITNTSHTTILTGLLPSTHGVTDFAVPLAATHPTWAELLKKKGYHTAPFIGAVVLDSKTLAPGLEIADSISMTTSLSIRRQNPAGDGWNAAGWTWYSMRKPG